MRGRCLKFGFQKWGFVLADFLKYRVIIRETPPRFLIAVYETALDGDLKDPAMSLNECRRKSEIVLDGGCQTGCRGKKTSFRTETDLNGHRFPDFVVHNDLIFLKN